MSLFDFNTAPSNDSNEVVVIQINDETIEVPAAECVNKTVTQLFNDYASGACDVSRINRYVAQGRIVPGNALVETGMVYTGAIASESKGA